MKSSEQEECVLCCRSIAIYATGECDHPVCYECSARMRVLCETNECPICRSSMPIVVFTNKQQLFKNIFKKFSLCDKKYNIMFEDANIMRAFEFLLENNCEKCEESCLTFDKLKEHVRRKHDLHFCDLCADNLKIFTFERKCYSRKDLARHRRIGDPDNTSHRGHPLCEFCDQRYIDRDDLFRHLRREHFFCHFCDADGKHQFYKDYEYLRVHFRKEHYLCEEGDCINEKFTGAFRSEIDLKAHIAVHHSKNKSKAEARQARMLEFEFTYAHHNRPSGSSSPRGNRFSQHRKRNIDENTRDNSKMNNHQTEVEIFDTQSTQEFPYLSEDTVNGTKSVPSAVPNTNLNSLTVQSYGRNSYTQRERNVMCEEDFPALSSTTVAVTSEVSNNQGRKINFSINRQNNPMRTSNVSIHLSQTNVPNRTFEEQKPRISNLDSTNMKSRPEPPKWITKKEISKFEDEFPKLEIKKTAVESFVSRGASADMVQDDASSVNSFTTSDNQISDKQQFIVIKSKSKKKKQNRPPAWMDNKEDSAQNGATTKLSTQFEKNLHDQENEDPFKKSLVRTPVVPKSNYMEDNSWEQKVSFGKDDFPPLVVSETIKKPPGFGVVRKQNPPPGFSASHTANSNPTPLNISLSSIARQIVIPDQNKINRRSEYSYKKPPDFDERNERLKVKIYELSNTQDSLFTEFKNLSGNFRQSKISAGDYHNKCLQILGEKGFMEIFPDLVSLLPDIKKQQELLAVHNSFLKCKSGAVPKQTIVGSNQILVCDRCQQVLIENDYKSHSFLHEVN